MFVMCVYSAHDCTCERIKWTCTARVTFVNQ